MYKKKRLQIYYFLENGFEYLKKKNQVDSKDDIILLLRAK